MGLGWGGEEGHGWGEGHGRGTWEGAEADERRLARAACAHHLGRTLVSVLLHNMLASHAHTPLQACNPPASPPLPPSPTSPTAHPHPDTPAERLLFLLGGLLEGRVPPTRSVASLMACLRSQQDLYRPQDLHHRIRQMDVGGVGGRKEGREGRAVGVVG